MKIANFKKYIHVSYEKLIKSEKGKYLDDVKEKKMHSTTGPWLS